MLVFIETRKFHNALGEAGLKCKAKIKIAFDMRRRANEMMKMKSSRAK